MGERTHLRFGLQEKENKRRERRMKLLVWLVLLILVFFGISSVYQFFTVKHVSCSLANGACDPETNALVEKLLHKSMASKLELPKDVQATITREWPNTVSVELLQGTTLLTLSPTASSSASYSVTIDGTLESPKTNTLPVPVSDQAIDTLKVGDKLDSTHLDLYRSLIQALRTHSYPGLTRILVVSSDEIRFFFRENTTAVLDANTLPSELASLQILLENPTIEKRNHTIDMRFHNPVIQ